MTTKPLPEEQGGRTNSNIWDQLSEILPEEQKQQIAELVLNRLAIGWGVIEIEFKDHYIKEFRDVKTIIARRSNQR